MRLLGWKSARLAGRWARSRISGAALILGYHRISEQTSDPYGLQVSPRHFDQQMEVLRGSADPVPLADLLGHLDRGSAARGKVAVTFDDGYADVGRVAEPVLRRYDIPATVFVVSGSIGRRLWWDELASALLDASDQDAALEAALASFSDSAAPSPLDRSEAGRQAALARAHHWLLHAGVETQQEFVNRVRTVRGPAASDSEVMGEDELARLSRCGRIAIGSHTVHHVPLAVMSEHQQFHELRESRRQLEAITGRAVRDLSYPHGSNGAATRRLAQESGYRSACASTPDAVRRGCDRFCLPRFWVPDWDGDRFARWLHRWQT